jgi:hypothetical protein
MLHALLHAKLDESIPEPQRREDALTSTIIGTLVLVEARHLLADWLTFAESRDGWPLGKVTADRHFDCWFWPRLRGAEPDVLLRMDDRLFLIETKLGSGRHDLSTPEETDEPPVTDQLCREWLAVQPACAADPAYLPTIRAAISECQPTLVYVVNQRALRKSRSELRESAAKTPGDADLRIVTWQHLYVLLDRDAPTRWVSDLARYLERVDLDAFTGFGKVVDYGADGPELLNWRSGSVSRDTSFLRQIMRPMVEGNELIRQLRSWRRNLGAGRKHDLRVRETMMRFAPEDLHAAQRWRSAANGRQRDDVALQIRQAVAPAIEHQIDRLQSHHANVSRKDRQHE